MVTEHLGESYWNNVFLFLAGLMHDGADELLRSMEDAAKKFEKPTVRKNFNNEFEEFRQSILQKWCDALNLKPALVHLEPHEREALEKYARAYLLMAQCKEAAVRVSPKTNIWDGIKEQMLLI